MKMRKPIGQLVKVQKVHCDQGFCVIKSYGFEPHRILWVFRGSVLGQDISKPQPTTGETQESQE